VRVNVARRFDEDRGGALHRLLREDRAEAFHADVAFADVRVTVAMLASWKLRVVRVDEDETILQPLEAAIGRYGTLVNVVAYEHDEIRRGVEKFKAARRDLEAHPSWAAIQEANRHGIFLVQFLWDHFRKERTSLFPTARERLPEAELESIRTRFAH